MQQYCHRPHQQYLEHTEDEWDRLMAVSVKGVYLCSDSVVPHMLPQGEGNITSITSVVGVVGMPKRAVCSASEGPVIALTIQVAIDHI